MKTQPYNIIFAGTPAFSAMVLAALIDSPHTIKAVYTQPDRPAGRGLMLTASPVKELALQHSLPVYQPSTFRDEKARATFADIHADIMVVVAFGLLLPSSVLHAPRLGCVNIHASLLPRFRGAAPIQRAILANDKKTGITIMQMDEGLDTGPMLYKIECPIMADDTSHSLSERLAPMGSHALLYTLDHLSEIKPQRQNQADATYAHKITKSEARLDWQLSAEELERKVRAYNPWPVAFIGKEENRIRVWQSIVMDTTTQKPPGEILKVDNEGIDVAAGKGVLRLIKIQRPGKRMQKVADILNAPHPDFVVGGVL